MHIINYHVFTFLIYYLLNDPYSRDGMTNNLIFCGLIAVLHFIDLIHTFTFYFVYYFISQECLEAPSVTSMSDEAYVNGLGNLVKFLVAPSQVSQFFWKSLFQ